jgi:hypothetical protein
MILRKINNLSENLMEDFAKYIITGVLFAPQI